MIGSPTVPTIRIVSEDPLSGGFVVINESDFNAFVHTKYGEDAQIKRGALAAPDFAASPETTKRGRPAKARDGQVQGSAD